MEGKDYYFKRGKTLFFVTVHKDKDRVFLAIKGKRGWEDIKELNYREFALEDSKSISCPEED